MKRMLLGNEALSLGAYMAGVTVATGYPGTPSTEILEYFANYPGVYAEWSPNEKVAMEVGVGAAMAGARTIVTMKHVGLNVAADPFFAVAYTGTEAGLVVISADDPGMHSSQGEQDNRNYAKFAKVPLLEPADSQECADMMRVGLEISEQFDTPVLLRTTTRVSHAQSLVEVDAERIQRPDARTAAAFQPKSRQVRDAALECAAAPAGAGGAVGAVAGVRRNHPAQLCHLGRPPPGHRHQQHRHRLRARGLPDRLVPQAGHGLPAAAPADPGLRPAGGHAADRGGARSVPGGADSSTSRVAADPNSLRRDCARARQGGAAGHRRVHARAGGQVRVGLRRADRRVRVRAIRLATGGPRAAIRYPAAPAPVVPRLRPSRHLLHVAAAHVPGPGAGERVQESEYKEQGAAVLGQSARTPRAEPVCPPRTWSDASSTGWW